MLAAAREQPAVSTLSPTPRPAAATTQLRRRCRCHRCHHRRQSWGEGGRCPRPRTRARQDARGGSPPEWIERHELIPPPARQQSAESCWTGAPQSQRGGARRQTQMTSSRSTPRSPTFAARRLWLCKVPEKKSRRVQSGQFARRWRARAEAPDGVARPKPTELAAHRLIAIAPQRARATSPRAAARQQPRPEKGRHRNQRRAQPGTRVRRSKGGCAGPRGERYGGRCNLVGRTWRHGPARRRCAWWG